MTQARAIHPVAEIFPILSGAELEALVEDIRANGLREPITLHPDGSILDGRNRYLACGQAGVEPRFVEWDGTGREAAFVISKNLARRHLNVSQRAMIATEMANMPRGGDRRSDQTANLPFVTNSQASQQFGVGERSVRHARKVLKHGSPEIIAAVKRGQMSVSRAVRMTLVEGSPPQRRQKRVSTMDGRRRNAWFWRRLRDGLEAINDLPAAAVVCKAVPPSAREIVARHLPAVIAWLRDFEAAWSENPR